MTKKHMTIEKILAISIIFIGLAAKLYFIIRDQTITVFQDEQLYLTFASSLYNHKMYTSTQYPLLYPLILSIGYLTGQNFYFTMKIINFVITTLTIIPVYYILKMYILKPKAALFASLVAIMPFNFIYPHFIMSENLYYLLIAIWMYFLLKIDFDNTSVRDFILCGFSFSLMWLTRHITFVLTPVMLIACVYKIYICQKKDIKDITIKTVLCVASCILPYMIWVALGLLNGENIFSILGLSVSAGVGAKDYLQIRTLLHFSVLYVLYFLLMIAPFFIIFIMFKIAGGKIKNSIWQLLIYCSFCTALLLVASIRHSWRGEYNYPDMQYLLGRYISYGFLLMYLVAIVLFFEMIEGNKKICNCNKKPIRVIWTCLVYSALVAISYYFFFCSNVFGGETFQHTIFINEAETLVYDLFGSLLILFLIIGAAFLVISAYYKTNYSIYCMVGFFVLFSGFQIANFIERDGIFVQYDNCKKVASATFDMPKDTVILNATNVNDDIVKYYYDIYDYKNQDLYPTFVDVTAENYLDEQNKYILTSSSLTDDDLMISSAQGAYYLVPYQEKYAKVALFQQLDLDEKEKNKWLLSDFEEISKKLEMGIGSAQSVWVMGNANVFVELAENQMAHVTKGETAFTFIIEDTIDPNIPYSVSIYSIDDFTKNTLYLYENQFYTREEIEEMNMWAMVNKRVSQ